MPLGKLKPSIPPVENDYGILITLKIRFARITDRPPSRNTDQHPSAPPPDTLLTRHNDLPITIAIPIDRQSSL